MNGPPLQRVAGLSGAPKPAARTRRRSARRLRRIVIRPGRSCARRHDSLCRGASIARELRAGDGSGAFRADAWRPLRSPVARADRPVDACRADAWRRNPRLYPRPGRLFARRNRLFLSDRWGRHARIWHLRSPCPRRETGLWFHHGRRRKSRARADRWKGEPRRNSFLPSPPCRSGPLRTDPEVEGAFRSVSILRDHVAFGPETDQPACGCGQIRQPVSPTGTQ